MTETTIQKGVPIPPAKGGNTGKKYPIQDLKVGDSFFAESKQRNVSGLLAYHQRSTGKKFVTRSENGGTRVWRIA